MRKALCFRQTAPRSRRFALPFALAVLAICIVRQLSIAAYADVRNTTSRAHFKSGGERSEMVLVEISATLKRIDARLERIEKSIVRTGDDR